MAIKRLWVNVTIIDCQEDCVEDCEEDCHVVMLDFRRNIELPCWSFKNYPDRDCATYHAVYGPKDANRQFEFS